MEAGGSTQMEQVSTLVDHTSQSTQRLLALAAEDTSERQSYKHPGSPVQGTLHINVRTYVRTSTLNLPLVE